MDARCKKLFISSDFYRYLTVHVTQPLTDDGQETPYVDGIEESSVATSPSTEDAPKKVEFWLDLRRTSIKPMEAIRFMESEGISPGLVDALILPDSDNNDGPSSEYVQILTVPQTMDGHNNDDSVNALPSNAALNMKFPHKNLLVDPIPALDAINIGTWIVADCRNVGTVEKREDHLQAFTTFLGAGSRLSVGSTLAASANISKGGVAILCDNIQEVWNASANIYSASAFANSVSTSEGILMISNSNDDAEVTRKSLKFAVVLPLDVPLWKVAETVFEEHQ